ncbi:ARGOS-like protein [Lycium barbarum]|uniref:ARGOS-like protein n=1 Tax=Lycium barbarum TaxID=112863 RepID=UPI00293E5E23|nr:ARGOS-like protein [Lycium barbarum]
MHLESSEAKLRSSKGFINLEQNQYFNNMMDLKTVKNSGAVQMQGKKMEYSRSFTQGHSKKMISMSYFSLESVILLLCLTASLLLLPLVLPPLAPPPLMLLLVPIFILVVLLILAFMPSNVRNVT